MNALTTPADVRRAHIEMMNRYAHALDSCDWALLSGLFAEDAVFAARRLVDRTGEADAFSLTGREVIIATISTIIEGLSATHHMLGNYVVESAADGASAKASCYMKAYHAGAGERAHLFEESLGRFDFETIRQGDGWKIRRMDETIMIMLGTPDAFATQMG
jgi:hypothetical protein